MLKGSCQGEGSGCQIKRLMLLLSVCWCTLSNDVMSSSTYWNDDTIPSRIVCTTHCTYDTALYSAVPHCLHRPSLSCCVAYFVCFACPTMASAPVTRRALCPVQSNEPHGHLRCTYAAPCSSNLHHPQRRQRHAQAVTCNGSWGRPAAP